MDAPKIPTLKDSQKPQVKVRGLEAGVTLFDRLKQFKKKDLAFILAGLGTLFMAPLAEHFMMAPEQASDLAPGINKGGAGGGSGLFGSGSSPYEVGANGLAQGAPSGGGSDIITPLNVRDPSALVMGPGATQQPPTQSAAPATPPPTAPATKDSDLRDALAASGARAAGAASKAAKALLPVPKVALSGAGGLRGLGVTSGGTSASSGGGAIQSSNSLSKANSGGGLSTVKALPGYRGTAGARGQGQGGSGIEALKAAADKQGNVMNQGSASAALDNAASQAIPNGGSGLGGSGAGGTGATDKGASGNQDKSAKNVTDSLEFLKQKAMQEKRIELWAKEQEAKDMNLLGHQILNDGMKTVASEGLFKPMAACIGNFMGGKPCIDPTGAGSWICNAPSEGAPPPFPIGSDKVTKDSSCAGSKDKPASYYRDSANNIFACGGGGKQVGKNCILNGGADAGPKGSTGDERSVQWAQNQKKVDGLGAGCDSADSLMKEKFAQGDSGKGVRDFLTEYKNQSTNAVAVRDGLGATAGAGGGCGTATLPSGAPTVKSHVQNVVTILSRNLTAVKGAVAAAPVPAKDGAPKPSAAWIADYELAQKELADAHAQMNGLKGKYDSYSDYVAKGTYKDPPKMGSSKAYFSDIGEAYNAEGNGIKDTYNKLNTQLATLDAVVNGAAPTAGAGANGTAGPANGAVKEVVPAGATAERTIQLRDDFAAKITKYNEAATRANTALLKADELTPKKDAGAAAPADPKTPVPAVTPTEIDKKIKDAKQALDPVAKKMDAFIAANADAATAAAPTAGKTEAPPVTQAEVDPVLTNVTATVTAQSANLDALLKDVQAVQPRGSGAQ